MLSNRINNIRISPIMKYNDTIKFREKKGITFYKVNIGQPNFKNIINSLNNL